ncbi:MAG: hypothetical protein J1F03_04625 [Oscillospiraceae bacterium]|nr:hypothetical protein [Oscillospiraceae bacterium]
MENVLIIILGAFIILCGLFLAFGAITGMLKFKNISAALRIRIGIIGGVLALIGAVLIITLFTDGGLIFSANG